MQFEEQPMLALNKAIKYGTILLAILFIIPVMKYKKIYAKEKLGFLGPKKVFLKNVFKGFLVSIVVSLPLLFFMNFLEIRNFNFAQISLDSYFFISLFIIIFLSFLISFIEESFFRGILIQKNRFLMNNIFILFSSSIVYSIFHFLKLPLILDENIYWYTGILELLNLFSNLFTSISYDAAITLFFFGILLGIIRQCFNTISYGIGIHAGFVFVIKNIRQNTSVNFDSNYNYLLSPYDHFTGHLSTIWIGILTLIYLFFLYKKNSN